MRKRDEDSDFYVALGKRLRLARGKRSQSQVALSVGLSRTSWVNIEQGKQAMTVAALTRYATALEISPADLLADRLAPLTDINVKTPSEYRTLRERVAQLEAIVNDMSRVGLRQSLDR